MNYKKLFAAFAVLAVSSQYLAAVDVENLSGRDVYLDVELRGKRNSMVLTTPGFILNKGQTASFPASSFGNYDNINVYAYYTDANQVCYDGSGYGYTSWYTIPAMAGSAKDFVIINEDITKQRHLAKRNEVVLKRNRSGVSNVCDKRYGYNFGLKTAMPAGKP